ncbi:MAG TPA: hypothetical protein VGX71_27560 [Pseudaminobacter sp.]|nr:hypothetical protein [Pseudaminobacter sp.]
MAQTEASLDKYLADEIERNELIIADHGGTPEEVIVFIEHRKKIMEAWKAETLAEIRRGLSDWDAPSGKLQ